MRLTNRCGKAGWVDYVPGPGVSMYGRKPVLCTFLKSSDVLHDRVLEKSLWTWPPWVTCAPAFYHKLGNAAHSGVSEILFFTKFHKWKKQRQKKWPTGRTVCFWTSSAVRQFKIADWRSDHNRPDNVLTICFYSLLQVSLYVYGIRHVFTKLLILIITNWLSSITNIVPITIRQWKNEGLCPYKTTLISKGQFKRNTGFVLWSFTFSTTLRIATKWLHIICINSVLHSLQILYVCRRGENLP